MSIAEKFVSAVKIAAQVMPFTAMMSQALDDIETGRIKARLDRLGDPLAKYGSRTKELMAGLYSKVQAGDYASTVIDWDPAFDSFGKELRELAAAGFLQAQHVVGAQSAKGIRLTNPGFIIDLALLFDNPAKSAKLNEMIDKSKQPLEGRQLAAAVELPVTVVNAFFKKI